MTLYNDWSLVIDDICKVRRKFTIWDFLLQYRKTCYSCELVLDVENRRKVWWVPHWNQRLWWQTIHHWFNFCCGATELPLCCTQNSSVSCVTCSFRPQAQVSCEASMSSENRNERERMDIKAIYSKSLNNFPK